MDRQGQRQDHQPAPQRQEAEIYQRWINNDRRLRAIIDELRTVAAEATEIILQQARHTDAKV